MAIKLLDQTMIKANCFQKNKLVQRTIFILDNLFLGSIIPVMGIKYSYG